MVLKSFPAFSQLENCRYYSQSWYLLSWQLGVVNTTNMNKLWLTWKFGWCVSKWGNMFDGPNLLVFILDHEHFHPKCFSNMCHIRLIYVLVPLSFTCMGYRSTFYENLNNQQLTVNIRKQTTRRTCVYAGKSYNNFKKKMVIWLTYDLLGFAHKMFDQPLRAPCGVQF